MKKKNKNGTAANNFFTLENLEVFTRKRPINKARLTLASRISATRKKIKKIKNRIDGAKECGEELIKEDQKKLKTTINELLFLLDRRTKSNKKNA